MNIFGRDQYTVTEDGGVYINKTYSRHGTKNLLTAQVKSLTVASFCDTNSEIFFGKEMSSATDFSAGGASDLPRSKRKSVIGSAKVPSQNVVPN